MKRFGASKRTKEGKLAQAAMILTMRACIAKLTAEELHRWTGLGLPQCAELLAKETERRAAG